MTNTDVVEQTNETLKTINPEQFAVAVFAQYNTDADKAIAALDHLPEYDIKTKDGMAIAKEQRKTFKELRIESDKDRKHYKAPVIETGKKIDEKYKDFLARIEEHEKRFDDEIKAEEKRLSDIKAEKMRMIAEREAEVNQRIEFITTAPLIAVNQSGDEAKALLEKIENLEITKADYDDRDVEAELAQKQTIPQLQQIIQGKEAQAKLKAEEDAKAADETRLNAIKAKISGIDQHLMDAMSAETQEALQKTIDKVQAIELGANEYQELLDQAAETKQRVLSMLARQKTLLPLEAEMQQASIPDGNGIKPEPAITATTNTPTPSKVTYYDEGKALVAPERSEMLSVFSKQYNVHMDVAEQWLIAEFGVAAA